MNEATTDNQRAYGDLRQPRLTVIIVNHESWPDVVRLTASLVADPAFASGRCHVVVVDNASRGPVPESLTSPPAGLRLVVSPSNQGFAAGVNTGWRLAKSRWLLLLNPDVDVTPGFLGKVLTRIDVQEANRNGPAGIIGFGLQNSDGTPQGSVGIFPTLWRTLREQFIPRSRRKYQAGWRIRSGPVDWVTGACMLVNSELFALLGGMDEDFFLYYEEVALCRAAQRSGWSVEYDASVNVVHRHPLQNRVISPKMRVITRHSKLLYFLKHLPRWQFLILIEIVRLEAAGQGVWSRLRSRPEEMCAWRAISELARQLRDGVGPRGGEVLTLAERVSKPAAANTHRPRATTLARRARPVRSRSVGPGRHEKRGV